MSKASFNRRRDTRTQEEFETDIVNRTLKERFLARLFLVEMRERGYTIRVEEAGNVDAGKVTKTSSCAPDYIFYVRGFKTFDRLPVDIKNCGISTKATFKTYQLQQYVKQGTYLLLFLGTGFIDKDPTKINYSETQWAIIKPEMIQQMLDDLNHYKDPNFGYKECVRVPKTKFANYFELEELQVKKILYSPEIDLNIA